MALESGPRPLSGPPAAGRGAALSRLARALSPARRRPGAPPRPGPPAEPSCPPGVEHPRQPGSAGEHLLQLRLGTGERAAQFYRTQVVAQLTPVMREFIGRMEMAFIATSDARGECDCSFRAGPAGFIRVIDDRTIAYPDYRGNGVMASLGNLLANPHIGIYLVDFAEDLIGLHVNGEARILTDAQLRELDPGRPDAEPPGRRAVAWVVVTVTEAYIHCSKHIPRLVPQPRTRHWGTDSPRHKRSDYFGVQSADSSLTSAGPGRLNGHGDHDRAR